MCGHSFCLNQTWHVKKDLNLSEISIINVAEANQRIFPIYTKKKKRFSFLILLSQLYAMSSHNFSFHLLNVRFKLKLICKCIVFFTYIWFPNWQWRVCFALANILRYFARAIHNGTPEAKQKALNRQKEGVFQK